MANHGDNRNGIRANVDLSESSVYGNGQAEFETDDVATADEIDCLEAIAGSAEEEPRVVEGKLGWQFDALDASTEEELDALKLDLDQDDQPFEAGEGSGRVDDKVAEEQVAAFTEVGPAALDRGGVSVVPGRDDTSAVLLRHHRRSEAGEDSDAILEGNIDPPLDEDLE
jgi:hypothetical protein